MKLHLILLLTFGLLFTACGGGGSTTSAPDAQSIAQTKIEAYANDNTEPMPTLQDYADAGVSGVTAENLAQMNAMVDDLEAEDVDTVEEINTLLTSLGINIVPVANAQTLTFAEDTTANAITLTGTDADNGTLTYTVVTQPTHGTLSGTAPSLTYTPTANYFGADSFTFSVNDGTDDSTVQTISITVTDVAEPNVVPVATAQTLTFAEDSTANIITLTASDEEDDELTYSIVSQPSHGTLGGTAPNLTYTPTADYFGADSFTFTVNDGTDDSQTVTVSITVTDVAETSTMAVKKTGQLLSYNEAGDQVADSSIKDDGFYQKGVTPSYTRDDDKEVVEDHLTGLMWQDDEEAKTIRKTWDDATTYCSELTLGTHTDWRLPTVVELQGIVVDGKSSPTIDTTVFVNYSTSNYYWSSTTYASNTNNAWYVHFHYGYTLYDSKSYSGYVRCVRAGQ